MAKKKKKQKRHRVFWFFVKLQIVLMLVVLGMVGYYYLGGYAKEVQALREDGLSKVRNSSEETFCSTETTEVFDCHSNLISTVKGEKDVYYISYGDIPSSAVNAIVSIEDKKFYNHIGIDFMAIARAAIAMVREREVKQGGSTITQQLARTVFLSNERTWQRKVEEIYIALELEKKYTKNQILEFYLNNVYFGNGYYGIEAASRGYFNKTVRNLDLSQVAFLCAIPNNPTLYNPFVNPQNTIKRRNRILYQMLKDKVILERQYDEACAKTIVLNPPKTKKNDYVETYAYYSAIRELMKLEGFHFRNVFATSAEKREYEKEYKELYERCQSSLFTEGYRIYTSIDLEKQKELQNAINSQLKGYTEKSKDGTYTLQGAGVCIDNLTGRVVAIVGGRQQERKGYTLNRAFQSFRQPGSSIKPLVVYTPYLEKGNTPDTKVEDKKVEDGPKERSYLGKITLRTAVEKSRNSVAWQIFDELTPAVGIQYLLDMNFSKIDSNDYYLPASLGGLYRGVSPLEMAAAYATLENDGFYREPTCIVRITDAKGNLILQTQQEEKSVYKANASRMMTDIMTGVLTRGTAKGKGLPNMPTAGKTGTTNENKDGWFVGYSHYYTTSIWVGYDKPRKLGVLQGGTYPAQIWHNFMLKIHKGLEKMEFMPYLDYEKQGVDGSYEKIKPKVEEVDEEEEETETKTETKTEEEPTEVEEDSIDEEDEKEDEPEEPEVEEEE
ncbi:penicillin-binding protein, 1A family [Lachnospiraceae bacterium XBB1006]|nr:penicillin-binding protein, 1A family [Lachnospiraceae bacterium XBB1006]